MAGHSKWHNIKHRKAAVDKKRGKMWSKCSRAIMAAARQGGGDPDSNLILRYAIDEARYANMPRDTIDRLVRKGSGEAGGENYESVRYEGYGPGGVAVIVDALTDNRTRTAGDLRLAFGKYGGNLGASGCVSYLFTSQGLIRVPATVGEERLMDAAISAGALDVEGPEGEGDERILTVTTTPTQMHAVRTALEAVKIPVNSAEISMIPASRVMVSGEAARNLLDLVDELEDLDDVQKVHAAFDVDEATLAAMQE
jgi:YebC/PmpR family DNA-binding regulatory protein